MSSVQRPLSELCVSQIEQRDPREQPDLLFPYIDIGSVNNRTKRIEAWKEIKGREASVRARQVVRAGDVLVSTVRPNLNTVAIVDTQLDGAICSTGFCVLRCGPELNPGYLFAFVQSQEFVDSLVELVQGALYPAVTDRQVLSQAIPWVELKLQQQLSSGFQDQFSSLAIAKSAAQKQLAELDLLPQKLLLKGFGQLDGIARKLRIGDVAITAGGSTPSRDRREYWTTAEDNRVPWVRTAEIAFDPITATRENVSLLAVKECRLQIGQPGTVLIAMFGEGKTRGQSAVLHIAATFNQACFAIFPNEAFEPDYLQLWLRSQYLALRQLAVGRGGSQANLNGSILNDLCVPWVDREKQREFVSSIGQQLKRAATGITAAKQQLAELDLLPQKLLAQVFGN